MSENEISYLTRKCIFKVFNTLGPGLLESVYEVALQDDLIRSGLNVKSQASLPFYYNGIKMENGYRVDLLIEDKVIIEIKSVEHLLEVHHKQILTYLKLSKLKLGLLVNFNCVHIEHSIFRKVNGL